MKLLILCGIPGSTRQYYVNKLKKDYEVISRDVIRDSLFGKDCYITNRTEEEVTREFDFKLRKSYLCELNIILDNTNCREDYIDRIIAECPVKYDVIVKFFPTSLFIAILRNYLSCIRGARWIPIPIIVKMKQNFDLINKNKYNKREVDFSQN